MPYLCRRCLTSLHIAWNLCIRSTLHAILSDLPQSYFNLNFGYRLFKSVRKMQGLSDFCVVLITAVESNTPLVKPRTLLFVVFFFEGHRLPREGKYGDVDCFWSCGRTRWRSRCVVAPWISSPRGVLSDRCWTCELPRGS